MLNVGLTGNIASGKSTVVELFKKWGATVIDADALAREAQAPGSAVLAAIAGRFGADVLAPGGGLDRAALRAKVMGDDTALAALNAIVHPAVQMPAARKRPQSQHVIDNAGTLAELERRAEEVFAELRRQAARAGVRNETPGQTLVLCAVDAKDAAAPVLKAIARRYTDAGMRIEQTTVKTIAKTLKSITPLSIVATAGAAEGARAAWEAAVPPRPCRLYHLSPDPDPIAVRLDLRPWGHDRVALSEEDGAGLAPRADLL